MWAGRFFYFFIKLYLKTFIMVEHSQLLTVILGYLTLLANIWETTEKTELGQWI